MLATLTVSDTVQIAYTSESLSSSAQKIYDVLRQAGELVKDHRGYHKNTSQVTFFCPLEIVALVAGVSRRTLYYTLAELRSNGFVALKGHFCTHNGQTRLDGSLWAVRLAEGNGPIVIDHDWLKKSYRNLGADIEAGKTAWNLIARSKLQENRLVDTDSILSFAIPPYLEPNTYDRAMESKGQVEELMDIPFMPLEGRNQAVARVAKLIANSFGAGEDSLRFYYWLIWQMLRLEKQGNDRFYQMFLLIQRVSIERRENACTNASGLFVHKLKSSPIWDELRAVKHTRVGLAPVAA